MAFLSSGWREAGYDRQTRSVSSPDLPPVYAQTHCAVSVDAITGLITTCVVLGLCGLLLLLDASALDVERVLAYVLVSLVSAFSIALMFFLIFRSNSETTTNAPERESSSASSILPPYLANLLYMSAPSLYLDFNRAAPRFVMTMDSRKAPECAVCLDKVTHGQSARRLPCKHVFHCGCADAWVLAARKNSCPLCSASICQSRDTDMARLPLDRRSIPIEVTAKNAK